MSRKRLLTAAVTILAVAVVAAVTVGVRVRAKRLVRCRFIDQTHCNQIQKGMAQDEVEAILGGPPGDFRTEPVWFPGTARWPGEVTKYWAGNQGRIVVDFDEKGDVVCARLIGAEHGPPRPGGIDTWVEVLWESSRSSSP